MPPSLAGERARAPEPLLGPAAPKPLPLDLRRFRPAEARVAAEWTHQIRAVTGGCRLAVPELFELRSGTTGVVGVLHPDRWELRNRRRDDEMTRRMAVDTRGRLVIPRGVQRCLGLAGCVVVSLATDKSRVLVWATNRLDDLLEVVE